MWQIIPHSYSTYNSTSSCITHMYCFNYCFILILLFACEKSLTIPTPLTSFCWNTHTYNSFNHCLILISLYLFPESMCVRGVCCVFMVMWVQWCVDTNLHTQHQTTRCISSHKLSCTPQKILISKAIAKISYFSKRYTCYSQRCVIARYYMLF